MNVQCPCCKGTGTLEADAGLSEAALLRTELARVWGIVGRLESSAYPIWRRHRGPSPDW